MELYSADIAHIKGLVDIWREKPDVELEATFGVGGTVDMETFLRVISRLKSKGLSEISQEDSLTIGLKDATRFTIKGDGPIKEYCRTNSLLGRDYTAIIKDRNISSKDEAYSDVILEDYNVKIKSRREIEYAKDDAHIQTILKSWPVQEKYFRLIHRWSIHANGVKFDMSMVRSTPKGKTVRSFEQIDILKQAPVYELEVEINREDFPQVDGVGPTTDAVYNKFIQGVGEILRGIQASPLLIRKSVVQTVLADYKKLTKLETFRGVNPVTLGLRHMTKEKQDGEPNIRDNYNVTDKADGLRVHAFTNDKGELFMIDMSMNVYRTGLSKSECANCLLDGEYVTQDKSNKALQDLLLFDIYYFNGKDVSQEPFKDGRYEDMKVWIQRWANDAGPVKQMKSCVLNVILKRFYLGKGDDIFGLAEQVLSANEKIRNYHTDGLIFTPNSLPIPAKAGVRFDEQFKWKPSKDNTIDFLISIEKDTETKKDSIQMGIRPDTEEDIRYKTLRLLVSSRDPPDPRGILLDKMPIESFRSSKPRPVIFTPMEYPDLMANTCYLETETDAQTEEEFVKTELGEPIRDKSIVEMRYDGTKPPGWRWIPMRIRIDKTERYARGVKKGDISRTMNSKIVADDIWLSIHNPVTEHMIRTGDEAPTAKERESMAVVPLGIQKKYREKARAIEDKSKVQTMLNFHNRYIKLELLYGAVFSGNGKKILDMAVGEASDLHKWIEKKADFVLGVDLAGESILNPEKGAYKRLVQRYERNIRDRRPVTIPPIFFAIGNSSLPIYDGTAGITDQEKDILRSIFGYPTQGPVPPLVQDTGAGELRGGVDSIVCMYALHYFFASEEMFGGFLDNIDKTLKVGGVFVGTNFDGEAVFNLLKDTREGETKVGMDSGSTLWEITKQYSAEDLPNDSSAFGMAVDVKFVTIGMSHIEYLVPWELLVSKMKSIGCELADATTLATMGLKSSTNMYKTSYDMLLKGGNKELYTIKSDAAKQFSFLNRWYVFKRVSKGGEAAVDQIAVEELAVEPTPGTTEPAAMGSVIAPALAEAPILEPTPAFTVAPSGILTQKKYELNEVFNFKEDSLPVDKKLKLPEAYTEYAARWLAPNAPFRIVEGGDEYPSITHFLAGMKFKYASSNPAVANEFSSQGRIHQEFNGKRVSQRDPKKGLDKKIHYKLLEEETEMIEAEAKKELRKNKTAYNDSKWNTLKDKYLREAIQQRLRLDKWFCIIVTAAIDQNKYLLYVDKETSELGGVRKADKTIKGDNKYGRYILEEAYQSPDFLKACVASGKEPPV
jgi:mRNA capping enzyme, catalytic domain/mRNA capping enzyme